MLRFVFLNKKNQRYSFYGFSDVVMIRFHIDRKGMRLPVDLFPHAKLLANFHIQFKVSRDYLFRELTLIGNILIRIWPNVNSHYMFIDLWYKSHTKKFNQCGRACSTTQIFVAHSICGEEILSCRGILDRSQESYIIAKKMHWKGSHPLKKKQNVKKIH